MQDLRETIIDAAVAVFMRYGVERSRMGDIAAEAGIARQTIYSIFSNKDAVLVAAIRLYSERSETALRQQWEGCHSLGEKLEAFYETAIIASYAIISASPDARDMIDGHNAAGKAEILRTQADKIALLAETLGAHVPASSMDLTAEQVATYIVLSSLGLRDQAANETQLRQLLAVQKKGLLALFDS